MEGEKEKAQTAQEEEVTLFDRIVSKEIKGNIIYEDDLVRDRSHHIGFGVQRHCSVGSNPLPGDPQKQNGSLHAEQGHQEPHPPSGTPDVGGSSCRRPGETGRRISSGGEQRKTRM
jgi:hypothetical protein